MTLIYLVRHAQASFGGADYDKLSGLGRRQAGVIGRSLAASGFRPDIIYTGKARRQRDTAALCMEQIAMYPEIEALEGFNEFNFVDVIRAHRPDLPDIPAISEILGQSVETAREVFDSAVGAWVGGAAELGYVEDFRTFRTRTIDAFDKVLRRSVERGAERVLVFSSAGPIAALTLNALGAADARFGELAWRVANGSVTRLQRIVRPGGVSEVKLISFNDYSAMEAENGMLTFK